MNAISSGESSGSGSLGFGDALVKATAAGARSAASDATASHAAKKPADKPADKKADADSGSKNEKTTQAVDVQPSPASTPKPSTALLPLQPMVPGANTPATDTTGSEDVVGAGEGSSDKALSAISGNPGDTGAARVTDGSAKQQGPSSIAASSTSAGENRPVTVRQAATTQVSGLKGNAVQGQDSQEDVESSVEVSGAGAPSRGDSTPDADGQAPGPGAAPGTDAGASMMLGIALPTQPAAVLDAGASDPGLDGSDGAAGLDLNAGGLSPATNGLSKNSSTGGALVAAKSKSGNADGDAATPSGTASFHKIAETVQLVAPSSGGAGANPNVIAAQTNSQAGLTSAGVSHGDAKSAQHGSGDASAESAGTALASAAPQSWDASATQVVHRAQLIQAMHQSEMRMGMNSAEFGNISISAAVSHQTLSAQISLDHPELSRALTAQLPDIEKSLGSAYGLPSRVEIRDSSSSSQQGSSSRDGDHSQDSVRGIANASALGVGSAGFARESASSGPYLPAAGMRLDIVI
jgi:hypothetical protein